MALHLLRSLLKRSVAVSVAAATALIPVSIVAGYFEPAAARQPTSSSQADHGLAGIDLTLASLSTYRSTVLEAVSILQLRQLSAQAICEEIGRQLGRNSQLAVLSPESIDATITNTVEILRPHLSYDEQRIRACLAKGFAQEVKQPRKKQALVDLLVLQDSEIYDSYGLRGSS